MLALASFASAANLRVCDPLLPQIADELGVTVGSAATVVTTFAVAYGVSQVVVGPLGDARGKLLMVVLGSLWAGFATVLSPPCPLGPLVFARFLAGAGAAAVIPLPLPGSATLFPTNGVSQFSPASSRGRSSASCSARRRAACWAI